MAQWRGRRGTIQRCLFTGSLVALITSSGPALAQSVDGDVAELEVQASPVRPGEAVTFRGRCLISGRRGDSAFVRVDLADRSVNVTVNVGSDGSFAGTLPTKPTDPPGSYQVGGLCSLQDQSIQLPDRPVVIAGLPVVSSSTSSTSTSGVSTATTIRRTAGPARPLPGRATYTG